MAGTHLPIVGSQFLLSCHPGHPALMAGSPQPCFVPSVPIMLLLGQARLTHQCKEANYTRMLALFPDPTLPNWLHK